MRLANPCLNGVYLMTPSSGILSASLGFPRIGRHRELKHALEDFWSGATGLDDLQKTTAALRARHWFVQQQAGVDHIPSNDFSLYD
jgi:5-methyltetrahydropteroyltriglutamate--homocysteine methyltransferase